MTVNTAENRGRRIWSSVEKIAGRYIVITEDGRETADPVMQPMVRNSLIAMRKFFWDNGLITVSPFDAKGEFVDGELFEADFTEEGLEMLRRKAERWSDSKAAQKTPPNYKPLEKILSEIRAAAK